ncbi:MAG: LysM peptidoglycan-binding domain-containing protein, partial [candidate division WOR-3 bacterium]
MRKMLILLVFVSIFAQETTHVVKEGDTLWDIAGW